MVITIIKICVGVYYAAANVYGFILLKLQKNAQDNSDNCNAVTDGKIFFAAMLGGAIGVYVAMFIFKYKLKSTAFMVLIPVIAAAHICLAVFGYLQNYNFAPSSTLAFAFKSSAAKSLAL